MGSTSSPRRHHISRPLPHPRLASSTLPPRGTVYVVERLGRFSRLLNSSSSNSPLLPLVDKVIAAYSTHRVEQSTPAQGLIALCWGRLTVTVHAQWSVQVVDPKNLAYRIEDVDRCVHSLVHVRIRDAFAALPPTALPSLANAHLLTTMSDGIRQSIDETSRKFGVVCPTFQISAVNPSQHPPARPQVLYYPQPVDPSPPDLNFPALPAPPTPANQRSLNLAAEPAADPPNAPLRDDFETVLPELPDNSYPMNTAKPEMTIDKDGEESDDDQTSLDDSSVENRPPADSDLPVVSTQTTYVKQTSPKSPNTTKEVLYAPPPSPTPSQDGTPQREVQSQEMLPEFVSQVLNGKPPAEGGALLATDSSYEELPPPPVLTAPAHPISPPMAAPTEEDFTPSLAKYLDGLPPTPTVDLPPSETSDEAREGLQQVVTAREEGGMRSKDCSDEKGGESGEMDGEVDENMQVRQEEVPTLSQEVQHMDETDDAIEGSMAADSLAVSSVSSALGNEVSQGNQRAILLEHKPLGILGEQTKMPEVDGLRWPPPENIPNYNDISTPVTRTMTETGSDAEEETKVEDPVDSFHSSEVKNNETKNMVVKEHATQVERVRDTAGPKYHVNATASQSVLVDDSGGSSVQNDPRRKRVQTPTSSIFEADSSGSMERLPRRSSDSSVGDNRVGKQDARDQIVRLPVTRSLGSVVRDNPANSNIGMPLRTSKGGAQWDNGYVSAARMDFERKRNIAAMSDYQPAGKRQVPSSAHAFDRTARQPIGDDVRRPLAEPQHQPDRHFLRSNAARVRAMGPESKSLDHRDISNYSEWQRTPEDHASSRKELARRERVRKELDVIEKSQSEILRANDISSDEEFRRLDVTQEEDSDSEHDIFHDAYSEKPPAIPVTTGHSHSKRYAKPSQRHRRNSRREEGFYAESSSSDEMCEECGHHRHFDYYDHERVHRSRDRSRSKSVSSRRRLQDDDADRYSESFSEVRSTGPSRSRGRSDRKASDSRRSDYNSRERSRKGKGSSSRDRRSDRPDKSERSSSEKRARESSKSRSKSSDRKRSHEKSSKSSRKSLREVEPEKRKRDGKSRSKNKHRKPRSPPPSEYAYNEYDGEPKSIYRHRVPDSDSGIENPIPWYCEGQSAPEDTDVDNHRYSSDSDPRGRRSARNNATMYSSYGQRDKRGRRRRAHHNRRVTFLYDNVTLTR